MAHACGLWAPLQWHGEICPAVPPRAGDTCILPSILSYISAQPSPSSAGRIAGTRTL